MGDLSGAWHNIVLVQDYNDSTSIFVDGQFIASSTATLTGNFNINAQPLVAGYGSDGNNLFYNGKIDDIRIYNRTLTQLETDSLFNEIDPMTVGINETASTNNIVSVYPNPTNETIFLSNNYNISLTDITGKVITAKVNSNLIDISTQPTGMYFIVLTDNNGQIVQRSKVIKK